MRITISISDITRRIYALSALRATTACGADTPAVLTRDNSTLLRRIIRDCFALTITRLRKVVSDFSELTPDDGGDLLWIEAEGLSCAPGVAAESLAAAVVALALAQAGVADGDEAGRYCGKLADEALGAISKSAISTGRALRHDF